MDIVLSPFNNPQLPIYSPGFVDWFERPAAPTLGQTDNGVLWHTFNAGTTTSTWGVTGRGTGTMLSSSTQHHLAVADGNSNNGTLTTVIARTGETSATRRFGLAIRVVDADNYIAIAPNTPNNPELRIYIRVGGQLFNTESRTPALTVGDQLSATIFGTLLTVRVNDEEVMQENLTNLPPNIRESTLHGLYAFYQAEAEWEYVEFTP